MISGICPNCEHENDFTDIPPFTHIKCAKCDTELIVPKIFGNFQLTDILDEYPILKNYKAHDLKTDEPIVISILNKKFPDFRECLNLCRKEAKELSSVIKHPGIIPITSYGEANNTFYAVSPYTEGFRLTAYDPQKLGEFEFESVLQLFKSISAILKEAHRNNFEHHNISPENIMLDEEGKVKILNFLPSRVLYKYQSDSKAEFSVSPYYISPEKAEKGKEDNKGDIFSLGVIIFFILTGKYPFDGSNNEKIIYSRIKRRHSRSSSIPYEAPPTVDQLRKDVPVEYADLINELLMPYPVQRPTAANIVNKLSLIEAELERQKSFEFYSKAVSFQAGSNSKINIELRKALQSDQLSLHYQPIVQLKSKNIIGFEALARWENSPVGNLSPESFIPEAENTVLINQLGLWAIESACKQLSEWNKKGFGYLYITLNISPDQIEEGSFEEKYNTLLKKYDIDPKQIELELATFNTDPNKKPSPELYVKLATLFNSRVSVEELDDKFSILKNHSKLKLSSLKIDDCFFNDAQKTTRLTDKLIKIINFSNTLPIKTVAEKIESNDQLDLLLRVGCEAGQGYLFHKPMPKNDATKLLEKK